MSKVQEVRISLIASGLTILMLATGCAAPERGSSSGKPDLKSIVPTSSSCAPADYDAGVKLIKRQLAAFADMDPEAAYKLASERFRENHSIQDFVSILLAQYTMLFNLRDYKIGACTKEDALFYFSLDLVDKEGIEYGMTYTISNLKGTWGIEGATVSTTLNN